MQSCKFPNSFTSFCGQAQLETRRGTLIIINEEISQMRSMDSWLLIWDLEWGSVHSWIQGESSRFLPEIFLLPVSHLKGQNTSLSLGREAWAVDRLFPAPRPISWWIEVHLVSNMVLFCLLEEELLPLIPSTHLSTALWEKDIAAHWRKNYKHRLKVPEKRKSFLLCASLSNFPA